jgi:hypothetical protein
MPGKACPAPGRVIGNLERGLIFALVLFGQAQGVGLLIAAKSILRFGAVKDDRRLSEYVIIGTLASFGWALVVAYATLAGLALLPPLGIRPRRPKLLGQRSHPMFGIPGKAAVTLTPAASRQITRLMAREGRQGLRIGVKKGGCAGMEYTMEYVAAVNPLDEVVEQDGARVMIAPWRRCS